MFSMERPKEFKLWDITLQAPLIVKNCLPMPSVITIDSGVGAVVSHRAPEASSVNYIIIFIFSVLFCSRINMIVNFIIMHMDLLI